MSDSPLTVARLFALNVSRRTSMLWSVEHAIFALRALVIERRGDELSVRSVRPRDQSSAVFARFLCCVERNDEEFFLNQAHS